MWFGVLGPLEVRDGERLIPVRGAIRTTLLAALICRAPQVALVRQLIEDLWGPNPPRSAEKTLQSHLFRLRQDLGPAGNCTVTSGSGYRIDLAGTEIDAQRNVIRTRNTPGDNPLLVAASNGKLWMTGNGAVWSVDPSCP
jgi:DNA-binding SARP family transcriptional activator